MTATAVTARWEAFLAKIEQAFAALMTEAREGCLDLARAGDTTAMSNAWQGVRSEVFALSERIGTTWREKVAATFEASGVEGDQLQREEDRGHELTRTLLHQLERQEILIWGEAGELVLERARAEDGQSFKCTQCGAALPVPQRSFRSVHVVCEYCRAINTFEPGTRARMVEHFCGHHLSQRAALEPWEELKAVERRRRDARGEHPALQADLERAARAYWQTYFVARARLIPDFENDVERDVEARVRATTKAR